MKIRVSSQLIILLFFLFGVVDRVDAKILFEDDFDAGDTGKWTVARDNCTFDDWTFSNGKLGIDIVNPGGCVTEIVPSDTYWDSAWNDYVIEVDMQFVNGTDKNIAWRYSNGSDWVDIHFQHGNVIFQRAVLLSSSNTFPFTDGNTYHLKIVVDGNLYYVEAYNLLTPSNVSTYLATSYTSYLTGRPALQASVGADFFSEVWFDNFQVSWIDRRLDIPHQSQKDPDWNTQEYDSASQIYPPGQTSIERWGCALTSASMVLNYHGFVSDALGNATTPSVLNQYLKNNGGYNEYGGVVWGKVSEYAKEATASASVADDLAQLEFSYSEYSESLAQSDFEDGNPPIIKIVMNNKGTSSHDDDDLHFVVSRGILDGDHYINDPWDLADTEAKLADNYSGKTYRQLGRFIKSHTDLSNLWLYQYNPEIKLKVERAGNEVGPDTADDLADWQWFFEGALTDALDNNNRYGGDDTGYLTIFGNQPESGVYKLVFSAESTQALDFELFPFDKNAASKRFDEPGIVQAGSELVVYLHYDKDDISNTYLTRLVDFDQLIADIIYSYEQGWIANWGQAESLISLVENAKRFWESNPEKSFKFIDMLGKSIDREYEEQLMNQQGRDFLESERAQLLIYMNEGN